LSIGTSRPPPPGAVTDAGDFVRLRLATGRDTDFRRWAVCVLVPFGRRRDQLAVVVAAGDVGKRDVRQLARMMQLLAPGFDPALVGEFAQQALELGAAVVLEIEGARDLARADLSGLLADEGEHLFL
jgi:hypothetical protein